MGRRGGKTQDGIRHGVSPAFDLKGVSPSSLAAFSFFLPPPMKYSPLCSTSCTCSFFLPPRPLIWIVGSAGFYFLRGFFVFFFAPFTTFVMGFC